MIISMTEEVEHPSTQVPKAMVMTIVINTIGGLLFLIPLMFVLPDISELVLLAQPTPTIIKSAVGSSGATIALLLPLMVLAILCGVACTTAASRCTWAFARDGAIPGSKWWSKVHPTLDLPLNAMMLSMAIQIALGLIWFGSPVAFNAFSGVGVISLTLSYAMPILGSMIGGRKQMKGAKFPLGKFGWLANGVALGMFCPLSLASLAVLTCSAQAGPPSRSPSFACPPSSPLRPPASTMRPSCWSALPLSPRSGTLLGAARTTVARRPRRLTAALRKDPSMSLTSRRPRRINHGSLDRLSTRHLVHLAFLYRSSTTSHHSRPYPGE